MRTGRSSSRFSSFVASFLGPWPRDERDFDEQAWGQLQRLVDLDASDWDGSVSRDPADPEFCFSFHGMALFPVGLHPAAGRKSRRFGYPTLVFNPHFQFEILRAEGLFDHWKKVIRAKDASLSGPNPFLVDHGTGPGWIQYTNVPRERCPLRPPAAPTAPAAAEGAEAAAAVDDLLVQHVCSQFRAFVAARPFPCIGAKSVLRNGGLTFRVYHDMTDPRSSRALAADLAAFVDAADVARRERLAALAV